MAGKWHVRLIGKLLEIAVLLTLILALLLAAAFAFGIDVTQLLEAIR